LKAKNCAAPRTSASAPGPTVFLREAHAGELSLTLRFPTGLDLAFRTLIAAELNHIKEGGFSLE
jgi:hypothetical protein